MAGHSWNLPTARSETVLCRSAIMKLKMGQCSFGFLILAFVLFPAFAEAQSPVGKFVGMWSDPPATITGDFCASWCTDAGIERLNALLDDAANDARPLGQIRAEADNYQREIYVRPRFTDAVLKTFPLDPADDPSFLRCEPYGFARQFIARHQLEIRQAGKDRLEMRKR